MTGEREKSNLDLGDEEAPRPESVRRYLLDNPAFFDQNADILRALTPAEQYQQSPVVDLQQFMAGRLRDDVARLHESRQQVIEASRANLRAQGEVHQAVLAIVAADTFEGMIAVITGDLADYLRIDAASLCIEAANEDPLGRVGRSGVFVLPQGAVDQIMGGKDHLLCDQAPPNDVFFGPATGLVRSFALARLHTSSKAPPGLLALGARDGEKFQSGQGTELLNFLVKVIEQQVRAWLHLPT